MLRRRLIAFAMAWPEFWLQNWSYLCFYSATVKSKTMPWLRRLFAGFLLRRLGFTPTQVYVGLLVDIVALLHVFLRVLRYPPVSIIPPGLPNHSCKMWGWTSDLGPQFNACGPRTMSLNLCPSDFGLNFSRKTWVKKAQMISVCL
jgi:hypothetical protein